MNIIQPKCDSCTLNCGKEWIVWGEGDSNSPDLFIIAEAPGGQDHYQHRPFVGKSGQVLRMTLDEISKITNKPISHYMTNIVMCRPPDDRNPVMGEILNCYDRLISEIQTVNPKAILLLGSVASDTLLNEKVTTSRGKLREWQGVPTMVTWHPGYVLKNQHLFKDLANDIQNLLLATLKPSTYPFPWSDPRQYTKVETVEECITLLKSIDSIYSLDLETTDLDPFYGFPLWIGIRYKGINYLIKQEIFEKCIEYYPSHIKVIVYDSRMEWKWMKRHYNIELLDVEDPLLVAHCLDERTRQTKKSLKVVAQENLAVHDWSVPVKPYINAMWQCPEDLLCEYLSYDIETEDELLPVLRDRAIKDDVWNCYVNVIQPSIPFVRKLTAHGIRVDVAYLQELAIVWGGPNGDGEGGKLGNAREVLRIMVGESTFNPGSWQQVAKHLYETLRLPRINEDSTDEKTITELSLQCDDPFLSKLLEYRGHQKLLSTYINGLIARVSPDGRAHFDYFLEGTETGRLSGPGQQFPRPTEEINIRKAFMPDENCQLFDADYSMLEVVVGAHLANDRNLIKFINDDRDVYIEVGTVFFGRSITKKERQFVKNMVLAVMYNSSIDGLVYNFKKEFPFLTVPLATKIINLIRETFPELYLRSLEVQAFVLKNNYIQSMFGRKRRFPLIDKFNRKEVLKQGANQPPQSGGSDICLLAGVRVDKELKEPRVQMINHDSLVGSIPIGYDTNKIAEIMSDVPFEHDVVFRVKVKVSDRWDS